MPRSFFKPEHITHGNILGRKTPFGGGMGSVILSRGGGGGGSSYTSTNEYHDITGRPVPMGSGLGAGMEMPMGRGMPKSLKGVNEKLQNLLAKPSQKKKNIVFNM